MKEEKKNQNKNVGIELLRIIAMFFILVGHSMSKSGVSEAVLDLDSKFASSRFLWAIIASRVDIFFLISGFFSCSAKFRSKKLIFVYGQVLFYSILMFVGLSLFTSYTADSKSVLQSFLPISTNSYWFASVYLGLYFMCPFLNCLMYQLQREQHGILLLVGFVYFCVFKIILGIDPFGVSVGHNLIWAMYMYLLGGYFKIYFRKNIDKIKSVYLVGIYVLLTILLFVIEEFYYLIGEPTDKFGMINSFIVVLISVDVFCLFFKLDEVLKKYSKLICWVATHTFSVYLIHENICFRNRLWQPLRLDEIVLENYGFLKIIILDIVLFLIFINISIVLSNIGKKVYSLLLHIKWFKYIVQKVDSKLEYYDCLMNKILIRDT